MRGKGPNKIPTHKGARITPAYAGKRLPLLDYSPACWDHPRVCGEKNCLQLRITEAMGSPPRMRGKVTPSRCSWACIGITPAYAGKRELNSLTSWQWRDPPRVCGEKYRFCNASLLVKGSPPRMRGKAAPSQGQDKPPGITPAYAGKRLKRSHRIGHFSCILCLFHSVLHRASASGGSRAGPCAPPCLPAQNAVPV